MGRRRAHSPLALLPLVVVVLSTVRADSDFKNDFKLYPEGARSCLQATSNDSGCAGSDAAQMNGCLCANGGNFILNSARCIGKESPDDLDAVWTQLSSNCNDSKTPVTISKSDFVEAGDEGKAEAAATTTTTATTAATATPSSPSSSSTADPTAATSTSTDTATPKNPKVDNSLGAGAIAGIAVGGILVFALIVVGAWVFLRHGRAKGGSRDEAHPMLASNIGPYTTGSSPGLYPTSAFATSPNTISELPAANQAQLASTAPPTAVSSPSWQKSTLSPSPKPGPNTWSVYSSSTPPGYNPNASWVSSTGIPPPWAYQGAAPMYEMPDTPAATHGGHMAAVEMDATNQPYRQGATAYRGGGGGGAGAM